MLVVVVEEGSAKVEKRSSSWAICALRKKARSASPPVSASAGACPVRTSMTSCPPLRRAASAANASACSSTTWVRVLGTRRVSTGTTACARIPASPVPSARRKRRRQAERHANARLPIFMPGSHLYPPRGRSLQGASPSSGGSVACLPRVLIQTIAPGPCGNMHLDTNTWWRMLSIAKWWVQTAKELFAKPARDRAP